MAMGAGKFGASLWALPKQEPRACSLAWNQAEARGLHLGGQARIEAMYQERRKNAVIQPWELGPRVTCMEVDFWSTEVVSQQHQSNAGRVSSLCVWTVWEKG